MFDSGLGGLTVLAALMAALPHERFVYLGDTARVPYGSKPLAMVRGFADEITAELLGREVKAIVIACNTASAASLPELAERCPVPVWGVVEPGVAAALRTHAADDSTEARIGVLGTVATIAARVYQDRLEAAGATTWARACPLFVPLVEEGLQDSDIARLVVAHYLSDRPALAAVILGCTHYPLLKPALALALGVDVTLIDSSEAVAAHVVGQLRSLALLALPASGGPAAAPGERLEYLVTGDVDVFLHTAGRLGGPAAPATHVDLGRPGQARPASVTRRVPAPTRAVNISPEAA